MPPSTRPEPDARHLALLDPPWPYGSAPPPATGRVRVEWIDGLADAHACRPDGTWIRLHSRRDPYGEATRWLTEVFGESAIPPVVVLLGAGVGWAVDALHDRSPGTTIVLFEPSAELAWHFLARRDWSRLLGSRRLRLLVGPDYAGASELGSSIDVAGDRRTVLSWPVSGRAFEAELREAMRKLEGALRGAAANAAARARFGSTYLLNTLANLGAIVRSPSLTSFVPATTGPAIVVGAGPSLDENARHLAAIADRALIIAVDTAAGPLRRHGIAPHFIVALDPSPANAAHLTEAPDLQRSWLIGEASLHPDVFRRFGRRAVTFRVGEDHPWPWLLEMGVDRPVLRAWGSVITTAFDLALEVGADPVVFAGLDLAYTGGHSHCRGTAHEERWAQGLAYEGTVDDLWPHLRSGPTLQETDLRGRPTLTSPVLVSFRDWLVERAAQSEARVLNASGAGILHGRRLGLATWVDVASLCSHRAHDGWREWWSAVRDTRPADLGSAAVPDFSVEDTVARLGPQWAQLASVTSGRMAEALRQGLADAQAPPPPAPRRRHAPRLLPLERTILVRSLLRQRWPADDELEPVPDARADLETLRAEAVSALRDLGAMASPLSNDAGSTPGGSHLGVVPALHTFAWSAAAVPLVRAVEDYAAEQSLSARKRADPREGLEPMRPAEPVTMSGAGPAPCAGSASTREREAQLAVQLEFLLAEAASLSSRTSEEAADLRARLAVVLHEIGRSGASAHGTDGWWMEMPATAAPESRTTRVGPIASPPWRLMRWLTGRLVREVVAPSGEKSLCEDPRVELIDRPGRWVVPRVIGAGVIPRSWLGFVVDAEHAAVTACGERYSVCMSADGSWRRLTAWPQSISGELPLPGGGWIAWNTPERYAMFRDAPDGAVRTQALGFQPLRVAVDDRGRPWWLGFQGGLWAGLPGEIRGPVAQTPLAINLHPVHGGVRLDPAYRDDAGRVQRVLARHAWEWQEADGRLHDSRLGPLGQSTSVSGSRGWVASAHPYADIVRLHHAGGDRAYWLGCYYPLTASWAGASLAVSTIDGDVLVFVGLRDTLDAER